MKLRSKQSKNRLRVGGIGLLLCVALSGTACGSSDATTAKDESNVATRGKIDVVPWKVVSVPGPRQLVLLSSVGYCAGEPRPVIKGVGIHYEGGAVILRVRALRVRTIKRGEFCGGMLAMLETRVRLRRDVESLKLYDGSSEPPKLRLP